MIRIFIHYAQLPVASSTNRVPCQNDHVFSLMFLVVLTREFAHGTQTLEQQRQDELSLKTKLLFLNNTNQQQKCDVD